MASALRKSSWNRIADAELNQWVDFVSLAYSQSFAVRRGALRPALRVVFCQEFTDDGPTILPFPKAEPDSELVVYANLGQLLDDLRCEAHRLHLVLQLD